MVIVGFLEAIIKKGSTITDINFIFEDPDTSTPPLKKLDIIFIVFFYLLILFGVIGSIFSISSSFKDIIKE